MEATRLVNLIFTLVSFTILARIIMTLVVSFISDPPPVLVSITQALVQVTEPILAPIRRVLPTFGTLDFSPLVAILLLSVIQALINRTVGG